MLFKLLKIVEKFIDNIHPNNAFPNEDLCEDLLLIEKNKINKKNKTNEKKYFEISSDIFKPYKTVNFCDVELQKLYGIVNEFILNTQYFNYPMQFARNCDISLEYFYTNSMVFLINPDMGYRIICNKNFLKYLKNFNHEDKKKLNYYDYYNDTMVDGPDIYIFTQDIEIHESFVSDVIYDKETQAYELSEFIESTYLEYNKYLTLNNYIKFVLYESEFNSNINYQFYQF